MDIREMVIADLRELADRLERDETLNVGIDRRFGLTTEYAASGFPARMDHNGSQTYVITINGGARDMGFRRMEEW